MPLLRWQTSSLCCTPLAADRRQGRPCFFCLPSHLPENLTCIVMQNWEKLRISGFVYFEQQFLFALLGASLQGGRCSLRLTGRAQAYLRIVAGLRPCVAPAVARFVSRVVLRLTCESFQGCGHTLLRPALAVARFVSPVVFGLPVNHRGAAALLVAGFVSQVVFRLTCESSPGCGRDLFDVWRPGEVRVVSS